MVSSAIDNGDDDNSNTILNKLPRFGKSKKEKQKDIEPFGTSESESPMVQRKTMVKGVIISPSQTLCKPPKWCRIEAPQQRFTHSLGWRLPWRTPLLLVDFI
jgi:hypothetical protein